MASITNQTNIEANVADVNDYESWEKRIEESDEDEDSIDSADYDDDDTVGVEEVQFSLEGVVAGAKVSDVSFPLPGTKVEQDTDCLLYTSPSPRDLSTSRMPSSA